jgi:O-antigen/teichoic acid export membrane protein
MIKILRNTTYKLLRFSEKWTKTDMVYFAKGGFWLTLGQIFSAGSAFLLSIAFANLLPKEVYGNYKYILSMASILSIPTLAGISTAITQAAAKGFDGSFIPAIKKRIKWGLLGAVSSVILAGYYFLQGNTTLTFGFLIAGIFLPFMDPFNSYISLLLGKKRFKVSTKYGIITKIIYTIAAAIVLFSTDNLYLIVLTYFIVYTLLRFIFLITTIKKSNLNNKKDERLISYGKHLSLMGIINTVAAQLDKILVFNQLGAIPLGVYSFAVAMPEQIKAILKNIQPLALPKFAQSKQIETRKTILIKMFKFSIAVLPIVVIYILIAPYIFSWLFPQYLDSVIYSQVFSISLLTISASLPVVFLQAQKETKKLYKLNIYSPIIQIITLFVFIYFFGLMGVITARILNRVINMFIVVMLINRN